MYDERTLSSAHTHTCTVQLPSFFALGGPLLTLPLSSGLSCSSAASPNPI